MSVMQRPEARGQRLVAARRIKRICTGQLCLRRQTNDMNLMEHSLASGRWLLTPEATA